MCGIVGVVSSKLVNHFISPQQFSEMITSLNHRGPDGSGMYDHDNFIIGHTRLAIQDISHNGHQPMISRCGNFALVFNGEIYNKNSLKEEFINDTVLKSQSDTEVVLEILSAHDIESTIRYFDGMFSLCFIDISNKTCYLTIDPSGEKPLYYTFDNDYLLFGSELPSITRFPNWTSPLSESGLSLYFGLGYIPAPFTIFKNVSKLRPKECLKISFSNSLVIDSIELKESKSLCSEISTNDSLSDLLDSAVQSQLISDRPVGVFLSGGVDSALVASSARKYSSDFESYTVKFEGYSNDESDIASNVSSRLDIRHNIFPFSSAEAFYFAENICRVYDEPFSDFSAIPTSFLSKYTSENSKVALTGDGADELFWGYSRHRFFSLLKLLSLFKGNLFKFIQAYKSDSKAFRVISILNSKAPFPVSINMKMLEPDLLYNKASFFDVFSKNFHFNFNRIDGVYDFERSVYLADSLLTKTDRASMHYGLELRSPFLSKSIKSYANCLVSNSKQNIFSSKIALRLVLKDRGLDDLIPSKKRGFGIPAASWLRGGFKSLIFDTINNSPVELHQVLDFTYINLLLDDHYKRGINRHNQLWTIVCFIRWYKINSKFVVWN